MGQCFFFVMLNFSHTDAPDRMKPSDFKDEKKLELADILEKSFKKVMEKHGLNKMSLQKYVIAQEKHQSGELHMHVPVQFSRQVEVYLIPKWADELREVHHIFLHIVKHPSYGVGLKYTCVPSRANR